MAVCIVEVIFIFTSIGDYYQKCMIGIPFQNGYNNTNIRCEMHLNSENHPRSGTTTYYYRCEQGYNWISTVDKNITGRCEMARDAVDFDLDVICGFNPDSRAELKYYQSEENTDKAKEIKNICESIYLNISCEQLAQKVCKNKYGGVSIEILAYVVVYFYCAIPFPMFILSNLQCFERFNSMLISGTISIWFFLIKLGIRMFIMSAYTITAMFCGTVIFGIIMLIIVVICIISAIRLCRGGYSEEYGENTCKVAFVTSCLKCWFYILAFMLTVPFIILIPMTKTAGIDNATNFAIMFNFRIFGIAFLTVLSLISAIINTITGYKIDLTTGISYILAPYV